MQKEHIAPSVSGLLEITWLAPSTENQRAQSKRDAGTELSQGFVTSLSGRSWWSGVLPFRVCTTDRKDKRRDHYAT
ncbi:hypothetical protein E2C01_031399 [Portunus trituberculatus]|uniref:Uncharacterized protein n=1 Tax=Portunus trituberculatus TaxID=210409 RepID=A0A5B7EZZ5_PORTR|nr:hypothetical protein [Portunus trituberculatus]